MSCPATPGLRLRPATPADRPFLVTVYGSTRADELAPVPWSDEQKHAFVEMQFAAQDAHYRAHYSGASFDVIELDGEPVGRLYVHRRERELRVMDVALVPAARGLGVGTRLLTDLLAEGARLGKAVTIHVEQHNRARELYLRLGFTPVELHGIYELLEVPAPAA